MFKKTALTSLMAISLLVATPHKVKASEAIAGIQIAGEAIKAAMPIIKPLIKIGFKGVKKGVNESIVLAKYLKNYRANKRHKNWEPFWIDRTSKKQEFQDIPTVPVRTVRIVVEEEERF
tara:strand:- start:1887 stop:2243 length:357 start_codon:yes stop_codon:yes gene_type:complete